MRKEDLKASLGRIKPREELITSTLAKIDEFREREERRSWLTSPVFATGLKVAGACCAFAIAVAVALSIAKGNKPETIQTPVGRTLAEIDTSGSETSNTNIASFTLEDDAPNGWIIVSGDVERFSFAELDDSEVSNGAIKKGRVAFSADNMIERSSEVSVDLEKTGTALEIDILFYDEESVNSFVALTSGKMILRITPAKGGTWNALDFIECSE